MQRAQSAGDVEIVGIDEIDIGTTHRAESEIAGRAGIGHVHAWQRELTHAGLPLGVKAPQLFPGYANFDLARDAGLGTGRPMPLMGGMR